LDGRGRAVVSANGCTRADVGAGRPADVKRLVSARGGCRVRVRGRARPGTADHARVYAYARDAIVAINSCWAWALACACALVLVWLCGSWCSGLARYRVVWLWAETSTLFGSNFIRSSPSPSKFSLPKEKYKGAQGCSN
jgi:hypothetical protein